MIVKGTYRVEQRAKVYKEKTYDVFIADFPATEEHVSWQFKACIFENITIEGLIETAKYAVLKGIAAPILAEKGWPAPGRTLELSTEKKFKAYQRIRNEVYAGFSIELTEAP